VFSRACMGQMSGPYSTMQYGYARVSTDDLTQVATLKAFQLGAKIGKFQFALRQSSSNGG